MSPKFSLQPVLDYRHTHVEVLEVELGRLLHMRKEAQEVMEQLVDRQSALSKELTAGQSTGEIDLVKIAQVRGSLKRIGVRLEHQKQRIEELMRREETKRADLVSAKKDEEVLETLKDKETAKFKAAENNKDLRLQDDIYIARAYRRSIEENGNQHNG